MPGLYHNEETLIKHNLMDGNYPCMFFHSVKNELEYGILDLTSLKEKLFL